MPINTPEGLIRPSVQLTCQDGNALAVIGAVASALREGRQPAGGRGRVRDEAMSGDYDHVLQTAMTYAEVE